MTGGRERERGAALRVACPIEEEATRRVVEQAIRVWLPQVELADDATLAIRTTLVADVLVLAAPRAGDAALDVLRWARAAGFGGAVVVVTPADAGTAAADEVRAGEATEWRRLAGCACPLGAGADERLAQALVDALHLAGDDVNADDAPAGDVAALRDELWETRRRLAVAEVAARLPHALNNPLAALLAEAQLLELESLLPEHRAAVRRMVALCRRMSAAVRELDVARPEVARTSGATPVRAPRADAASSLGAGRGSGEWFGPRVG